MHKITRIKQQLKWSEEKFSLLKVLRCIDGWLSERRIWYWDWHNLRAQPQCTYHFRFFERSLLFVWYPALWNGVANGGVKKEPHRIMSYFFIFVKALTIPFREGNFITDTFIFKAQSTTQTVHGKVWHDLTLTGRLDYNQESVTKELSKNAFFAFASYTLF